MQTCFIWLGIATLAVPVWGDESAVENWPQFLGPQRTGISHATGLIDEWPEDGLEVVWRSPGGVGMSGIAVDQGLAVTLVQRGGKHFLEPLVFLG